jgi:diguanylate cyclase (GGDEF)-like protein
LALYGMIKSLSEALSWEDVRPKLETAVDQVLGVNAFAFYAAGKEKGAPFKLLSMRRLEGSPGANWVTLARHLQERNLTPAHSLATDSPEPSVGVPIVENGEVLGYFYAKVPSGQPSAAALGKAQGFAQDIGFAFRRIRLFQEVEDLSHIDGLTGVYRRGAFDDRIRQEAVRAKTFKTTFGLMLLDIDHFKGLNDRYGHPFGDQVLKRVGELLNSSVYETDFVARYGGEEFVVLLPRADPEGAARKAEAIRRAIEAEGFAMGFDPVKVTVSIGLAHFPRDAATPEELISQADAAMYAAKSQGRNRVIDCRAMRSSDNG